MVTLNELMNLYNSRQLKVHDEMFRAELCVDDTETLILYRFDGTLDDEDVILATIYPSLAIEVGDMFYEFNDDCWDILYDEGYEPEVNDYAYEILKNIVYAYFIISSHCFEQSIYLNKMLELNYIDCEKITDIYNRTWSIKDGKVVVEGDDK